MFFFFCNLFVYDFIWHCGIGFHFISLLFNGQSIDNPRYVWAYINISLIIRDEAKLGIHQETNGT